MYNCIEAGCDDNLLLKIALSNRINTISNIISQLPFYTSDFSDVKNQILDTIKDISDDDINYNYMVTGFNDLADYLKSYSIDCVIVAFNFCMMGYLNGNGKTGNKTRQNKALFHFSASL